MLLFLLTLRCCVQSNVDLVGGLQSYVVLGCRVEARLRVFMAAMLSVQLSTLLYAVDCITSALLTSAGDKLVIC